MPDHKGTGFLAQRVAKLRGECAECSYGRLAAKVAQGS